MARVLLVDDEPNLRWTMTEILTRHGHEACSAADFESAVAVLGQEEIDVAVIDVILPGKGGIDLLKSLRNRADYIPAVMITGKPDLALMGEMLQAGACDFMTKPVLKEALLAAVSRAMEVKRLVGEKRKLEEEVRRHAEQLETLVQERTRELAEAHAFLNLVLDSCTEYGIVAINTEGRITLFNRGAESIFGSSQKQAVGSPVFGFFVECVPDQSSLNNPGQLSWSNGHYSFEAKLRRADDAAFVGAITATMIRGSDGGILGYLGIVRDLTATRERERAMEDLGERLANAERIAELGRVAAQVAHEIKNPLAGLQLYASHLRSKLAVGESASCLELADKTVKTIDYLSETVERVLDFARPVALDRKPVELNRIVTEALQILEPQIIASRVEVELHLRPRGPVGMLNEAAIRSAVINLLLNAVQAMPEGGRLTVTTDEREGSLLLEITDGGRGIGAARMERLFEPFFTTKSRGLGLGLPYAKKVIDEHRGAIEIQSAEGHGTRVEIRLPAEERKAEEYNYVASSTQGARS